MKCKLHRYWEEVRPYSGLIEAYWNVNKYIDMERLVDGLGLIEAYWNVNLFSIVMPNIENNGLIEAYWNVNQGVNEESVEVKLGFNRSILKCKYWR